MILALAIACRSNRSDVRADPTDAKVKEEPPAALFEWLRSAEVDEAKFARKVLYTWTTLEQVDELALKKELLTRGGSSIGQSGYVSDLNRSIAPYTKRLLGVEFERMRFAWTAGWPTTLGLANKSYGDRLIRVVLKPNAWVAKFERNVGLRFHDLEDHEVSEADFDAHPERLGAVFHVHIPESQEDLRYREYALVNEFMIEEWSVGTEAIAAMLDTDKRNVRLLEKFLPTDAKVDVAQIWHAGAPPDDLAANYVGALAFHNMAYAPSSVQWPPLIAALALPKPARDPITHRPTVAWPSPPLPVPRKPSKPTVW